MASAIWQLLMSLSVLLTLVPWLKRKRAIIRRALLVWLIESRDPQPIPRLDSPTLCVYRDGKTISRASKYKTIIFQYFFPGRPHFSFCDIHWRKLFQMRFNSSQWFTTCNFIGQLQNFRSEATLYCIPSSKESKGQVFRDHSQSLILKKLKQHLTGN